MINTSTKSELFTPENTPGMIWACTISSIPDGYMGVSRMTFELTAGLVCEADLDSGIELGELPLVAAYFMKETVGRGGREHRGKLVNRLTRVDRVREAPFDMPVVGRLVAHPVDDVSMDELAHSLAAEYLPPCGREPAAHHATLVGDVAVGGFEQALLRNNAPYEHPLRRGVAFMTAPEVRAHILAGAQPLAI